MVIVLYFIKIYWLTPLMKLNAGPRIHIGLSRAGPGPGAPERPSPKRSALNATLKMIKNAS